jgi:hypothetical protein
MADEPGADIAGSYAFINAVGYGNDYHKGWLASGARSRRTHRSIRTGGGAASRGRTAHGDGAQGQGPSCEP